MRVYGVGVYIVGVYTVGVYTVGVYIAGVYIVRVGCCSLLELLLPAGTVARVMLESQIIICRICSHVFPCP